MLLEANQNDGDKMLDAVLLSQYRKLTTADNGITGFKPVISVQVEQDCDIKGETGGVFATDCGNDA